MQVEQVFTTEAQEEHLVIVMQKPHGIDIMTFFCFFTNQGCWSPVFVLHPHASF